MASTTNSTTYTELIQHVSSDQNNNTNDDGEMVESETMEWNSAIEGRHYEIYMPMFSYLLGMYLITVGKDTVDFVFKKQELRTQSQIGTNLSNLLILTLSVISTPF